MDIKLNDVRTSPTAWARISINFEIKVSDSGWVDDISITHYFGEASNAATATLIGCMWLQIGQMQFPAFEDALSASFRLNVEDRSIWFRKIYPNVPLFRIEDLPKKQEQPIHSMLIELRLDWQDQYERDFRASNQVYMAIQSMADGLLIESYAHGEHDEEIEEASAKLKEGGEDQLLDFEQNKIDVAPYLIEELMVSYISILEASIKIEKEGEDVPALSQETRYLIGRMAGFRRTAIKEGLMMIEKSPRQHLMAVVDMMEGVEELTLIRNEFIKILVEVENKENSS